MTEAGARRPFFRRRKSCPFTGPNAPKIDYKDSKLLMRYVSERGKVQKISKLPSTSGRIPSVSTEGRRGRRKPNRHQNGERIQALNRLSVRAFRRVLDGEAWAFKFGLRAGRRKVSTSPDSTIARKAAEYFVSLSRRTLDSARELGGLEGTIRSSGNRPANSASSSARNSSDVKLVISASFSSASTCAALP